MKSGLEYETVVGLEVHMQMSTLTKAYASEAYHYGAQANTQVSPVSLALPGTLPVANTEVINNAIKLGVACGCDIREWNEYARKNYFYPDLPKGYQITQHETPICSGGFIEIGSDTVPTKRIGLTRIHMEEDTGKSIHDLDPFNTLLDLNRAGVPLLEMVSEPDFRTGEEAYLFLLEVRKLIRYLQISDGNMEEGSMRCDVNVSIREKGTEPLGVKVEVKNLNSFRHVQKAIDFEYQRQKAALDADETIYQETRTFDAVNGRTIAMRSKEDANDYRYFTEPDLAPVRVSQEHIDAIASKLPPLPNALKKIYVEKLGLSDYDAKLLTETRETALYFEALLDAKCPAKSGANWLMGPVQGWLNDKAMEWRDFPIAAKQLAALIQLVDENTISFSAGQQLLPELVDNPNVDPKSLAEKLGLLQESDSEAIMEHVEAAIAAYPDKVLEYQAGKKGLMGLFMGEVMKRSRGAADPKVATQLLRDKLES